MAPKNNPLPRPRSPAKPLNRRQRAFVRHYSDPESPGYGNATVAAKLARYGGKPGSNQLAVQGHRLLRNRSILEALLIAAENAAAGLNDVAQCLGRALHATEIREVRNAKGKLEFARMPRSDVQLEAAKLLIRVMEAHARLSGASVQRGQPVLNRPELDDSVRGDIEPSPAERSPRNEFAEATSHERMLARNAIEATEAWVEIEHRTRATTGRKGDEGKGASDIAGRAQDGGGD